MKQKGRKRLSVLLILALAVGLWPWMNAPTLAENTEPSETLNLCDRQSGRFLPSTDPVTVSGINAEATGYAWGDDGWPVGFVEYGGTYNLSIKTKNRKPIIVRVVLEIGDSWETITSISAAPGDTSSIKIGENTLTYENSSGVSSVTFSANQSSTTGNDYVQFKSATVYYKPAPPYTVNVTPGDNMTRNSSSGEELQSDLYGAMTAVVYTAKGGYKFPTQSEYYKTTFGVTVTRTSNTEVTVSGTPTVDAAVRVPDAIPDSALINGVSLNSTSFTLTEDGKQALTATIEPTDAAYKKVRWSNATKDFYKDEENAVELYADPACTTKVGTAPTDCLTVYVKGNVEGKAEVTVKSDADYNKTAKCEVTVTPVVTEWLVGQRLNLRGKYFLIEDGKVSTKIRKRSLNVSVTAPKPYYDGDGGSWWEFGAFIPSKYGLMIESQPIELTSPPGKTQADVPSGFRVKEGNGRINTPLVFELVYYGVSITPGGHMTKTADSGAARQTGLTGAMTDVVYTANDGYYFPTDYSVPASEGVTVSREDYTRIVVSGTPAGEAVIALSAPTAKTKPAAPITAAAEDFTTPENNDGKLTGVSNAMEYKKAEDAVWITGTGRDITGLSPGDYQVRVKATETSLASDAQKLIVNAFAKNGEATPYTVASVSGGTHVIGSGKTAVIIVKRRFGDAETFKRFIGVSVDGKTVKKENSYTAKAGSLVLEFKAGYLDTLSAGRHAVTIAFDDGKAESSLTIQTAPVPTPNPNPTPTMKPIPKTGDSENPGLWIGMLLIGLLGALLQAGRRNARKAGK